MQAAPYSSQFVNLENELYKGNGKDLWQDGQNSYLEIYAEVLSIRGRETIIKIWLNYFKYEKIKIW